MCLLAQRVGKKGTGSVTLTTLYCRRQAVTVIVPSVAKICNPYNSYFRVRLIMSDTDNNFFVKIEWLETKQSVPWKEVRVSFVLLFFSYFYI